MVRLAVERYQKDLERQETDDFPYHLDARQAQRFCAFFPLLLRHSIGVWAGEPFATSPFQTFINWNLFGWKRSDGTRRFRRAFISMARKQGKSTHCAGLTITLASADRESGRRCLSGPPDWTRPGSSITRPNECSGSHDQHGTGDAGPRRNDAQANRTAICLAGPSRAIEEPISCGNCPSPVASLRPRLHTESTQNSARTKTGPEEQSSGPRFLRNVSRVFCAFRKVGSEVHRTHPTENRR